MAEDKLAEMDLMWILEAADTIQKKAQFSLLLASAAMGDVLIYQEGEDVTVKAVMIKNLLHYREISRKMCDEMDPELFKKMQAYFSSALFTEEGNA